MSILGKRNSSTMDPDKALQLIHVSNAPNERTRKEYSNCENIEEDVSVEYTEE